LFPVTSVGRACWALKCGFCGLVFKSVLPEDKVLDGIYSDGYAHFQGGADSATEADTLSITDKLLACRSANEALRRKSRYRVLDVGCGRGAVVRILRELGHDALGVDPYLPAALIQPYLFRSTADLAGQEGFDIVLMLNVAEHLPRPERLFGSIRPLIARGGALLLTCPFGDSLARRVFCAKWNQMALDEHLLFWTQSSLEALFRRLHFEGRLTCRILGTPFPLGQVASLPDGTAGEARGQALLSRAVKEPVPTNRKAPGLIWKIARRIQSNARLASLARSALAASRLGDYMQAVFSQGGTK